MKYLKPYPYVFVILFCMALSPISHAKNYVIILSPLQTQEDLKSQVGEVLSFVFTRMKIGDKAYAIDGAQIKTIGEYESRYANPKANAQVNRSFVAAMSLFVQNPIAIPDHAVAAAIKLPHVMEFLGQNHRSFSGADIIILGSPIYADMNNPEWSMKGHKWFNDGFLNAPSSESVVSIQGRAEFLKGSRVHWGFLNKNWIVNESYAFHQKRMWTLYIEGNGAVLSSFTDDMDTLWKNAEESAGALAHDFKLDDTTKPEIFMVEEPKTETPIYQREITEGVPSLSTIRRAKNVEIAISWDCKPCDLDLYVKPHNGADIIYHGNRSTPEGFYHKVYSQSPTTSNGFEVVTIKSDVDLRDTMIGVNWASGANLNGVKGEFRISIDGVTYASAFEMPHGSGGGHRENFASTLASGETCIHWVVLKPTTLLGVN